MYAKRLAQILKAATLGHKKKTDWQVWVKVQGTVVSFFSTNGHWAFFHDETLRVGAFWEAGEYLFEKDQILAVFNLGKAHKNAETELARNGALRAGEGVCQALVSPWPEDKTSTLQRRGGRPTLRNMRFDPDYLILQGKVFKEMSLVPELTFVDLLNRGHGATILVSTSENTSLLICCRVNPDVEPAELPLAQDLDAVLLGLSACVSLVKAKEFLDRAKGYETLLQASLDLLESRKQEAISRITEG